jgi:hypothetical protein
MFLAVYKLIVQYTIDYFLHYVDIKTHRQRNRKTHWEYQWDCCPDHLCVVKTSE